MGKRGKFFYVLVKCNLSPSINAAWRLFWLVPLNGKILRQLPGGWLILLEVGWYQAVSFPVFPVVSKDVSLVTSSQLSHRWVSVGTQTVEAILDICHAPNALSCYSGCSRATWFTAVREIGEQRGDDQHKRFTGLMRRGCGGPRPLLLLRDTLSPLLSSADVIVRAPNVQGGGDLQF